MDCPPTCSRRSFAGPALVLQVAQAADRVLDCVTELGSEWADSVRRLRFEVHNHAWLEMVASEDERLRGDSQPPLLSQC